MKAKQGNSATASAAKPGPNARQKLASLADQLTSSAEAKPAEWSRFGQIEAGTIVD